MGDDDLTAGLGSGGDADSANSRGVESVRDQMELAVGLLRISRTNLAPGCLGHSNNGGRICHSISFARSSYCAGTLLGAEEEADKIEGGREPFVAEVNDDGQAGKFLAEFLNQQNAGERRNGDKHEVDIPRPNNAARGARKYREPSHLGIGLQNSLKSSFKKVRLAGWRTQRLYFGRWLSSGDESLDPLLYAERKVECDGPMNRDFARNLLEQRRDRNRQPMRCARSARRAGFLRREIARKARGPQNPAPPTGGNE